MTSITLSTPQQSAASFRREREAGWLEFEDLLGRVERRPAWMVSEDDMLALPRLYRSTLSSLSIARETVLDAALVDYLEGLSLRGYFAVYGVKPEFLHSFGRFFSTDLPLAMRAIWKQTIFAVMLLVLGAVAGWVLVAMDPGWFNSMVPGGLADGRGPDASVEMLKSGLYDSGDNADHGAFATYLFWNNSQVAITVFALGFAFAVPSILLTLSNGVMLGAFLQVYFSKGIGWNLVGWLSIHGTTELFAIALACAAGIRIGTAVAFPGEDTRVDAAVKAGRTSATAMLGVVIMLVVAGLLEGFARQRITSDAIRYTIGIGMALFWIFYFYIKPVRRYGDVYG